MAGGGGGAGTRILERTGLPVQLYRVHVKLHVCVHTVI